MYDQYWSLNRRPFENDTSSDFFFRSKAHQSALLKLRYVVENRLGAALLVGGFGYGKTYLAYRLIDELPAEAGPLVHIVYPQLTAQELLGYLAAELGADDVFTEERCLDRTIRQIEAQLKRHAEQGRQPVIFIDEAHLIDDVEALHALHLLLNFQQRPGIDFTLALVGERSLLSHVQRIEPLDERIAVKALLPPLPYDDVRRYVEHRLQIAGRTQPIFDDGAMTAIFEISGGVPRKINRLCDLALLVGYADELSHISAAEVEAVAEELTSVVPE